LLAGVVINGGLLVVIVGARLALGIPLLSIGLGLAGRVARPTAAWSHGVHGRLGLAVLTIVLQDLPKVVDGDLFSGSLVDTLGSLVSAYHMLKRDALRLSGFAIVVSSLLIIPVDELYL
jgi:hypothetical protein